MATDPFRSAGAEPYPSAPMEPFTPVAPEPFDPAGNAAAFSGPVRATRGGSRAMNMTLAVAVLVAASGVAFALGRVSTPAVATTLVGSANGAGAANGASNGAGGGAPNGIGNGGLPGASLDPNGNGNAGTGRPGDGDGGRGGFGGFGGFGGLSIQGTVQSVTATSITIRTANGLTVTIGLGNGTAYHQQAPASQSDVAAGKTVILKLTGGFRPNDNGGSANGAVTLGNASDVTVVP